MIEYRNDIAPEDLKPDTEVVRHHHTRTYVAVVGWAGDWTVYEGLPSWSDAKVASNGDKIGKDLGELLFPACVAAGLEWRY